MTKKLGVRRIRLYWAQGSCCDCCGREMWEKRLERATEFRDRMKQAGLMISGSQAHDDYRCTYEHFTPTSRGGTPDALRDVATCAECNRTRGVLPYPQFKEATRVTGSPQKARRLLKVAA